MAEEDEVDEENSEEEIEDDIDHEDEDKLRKRILKYREFIEEKDPSVLFRLDRKFSDLKFGLEEQAKLLAKSIPVAASIFFDFESTTEESLILTNERGCDHVHDVKGLVLPRLCQYLENRRR